MSNDFNSAPGQQMKRFITLIGRGQRAGTTLNQLEAEQAMRLILSGKVSDAQKGAFLMLLRVREETPEELAGFLSACRSTNMPLPVSADYDLGCYAGKRRHLPWFLLAVMCLAQSGKRIFMHGTHEPDSQRLYLSAVFEELGLPIAESPEQVNQHLDYFGFTYADLSWLNPPVWSLINMRSELGLRSCANTLARMLNPSRAGISVQGVFHRGIDGKHARVATLLTESNVTVFRGEGGEIEVNPERAFELYRCSQGHQTICTVQPLNEQWSIKPKTLNCSELIDVWEGKLDCYYGRSAILGTLTVLLAADSDQQSLESLQARALQLWQSRDKCWPVLPQVCSA